MAPGSASAPEIQEFTLSSRVDEVILIGDSVRISVVCPFFNEESIIELAALRMLGNLRQHLGPDGWELILVDDGSKDSSLEILLRTLRMEPGAVRLITLARNQGRGRALKTGIDAARGDVIITTEVDCSWGDDIVPRLVNVLEEQPEIDFVVASPHLPGGGLANVPLNRVLLTTVGNMIIRGLFASGVTMNTGMTRAYRRGVIQPLVAHENGKEFHLEVLLKLLTLGFKAGEIPATITWQDEKLARHVESKRRSSTNIQKTINSHLRFVAIAQPVRYFAWFAFLSLLVGLGFIVSAVWMLIVHGPAVFLAIIGLIMLLFSLLFLGFSVVFFQMRENMREEWMRSYPLPHPPSAQRGVPVALDKALAE